MKASTTEPVCGSNYLRPISQKEAIVHWSLILCLKASVFTVALADSCYGLDLTPQNSDAFKSLSTESIDFTALMLRGLGNPDRGQLPLPDRASDPARFYVIKASNCSRLENGNKSEAIEYLAAALENNYWYRPARSMILSFLRGREFDFVAADHRELVCDVLAEEREYELLFAVASYFLEDEPQCIGLLLKHGLAAVQLGKTGRALRDIEKLKAMKVSSQQQNIELAYLYFQLDLLSDALRRVSAVVQQDSHNYDALRLLARIYFALHHPQECRRILERLETVNQYDVHCYGLMALIAYRDEDYERCLRYGAYLSGDPRVSEDVRRAVMMSKSLFRGGGEPGHTPQQF